MATHSEAWESIHRAERDLWKTACAIHPSYVRGPYDCWVLCPRAHAQAHLRCILELTPEAYPGLPGMRWLAQQTFAHVDRYHPGEDLVFAVGDSQ